MSKNIKLPTKSPKTRWITSTTPKNDRLIFMALTEYERHIEQLKKKPTAKNKSFLKALISNAKPVRVKKYYSPSSALIRKFKLSPCIIIRFGTLDLYEIWNQREYDRQSPAMRQYWGEIPMMVLDTKNVSKYWQLD